MMIFLLVVFCENIQDCNLMMKIIYSIKLWISYYFPLYYISNFINTEINENLRKFLIDYLFFLLIIYSFSATTATAETTTLNETDD